MSALQAGSKGNGKESAMQLLSNRQAKKQTMIDELPFSWTTVVSALQLGFALLQSS
jgi:hypothetical protein